MNHTAKLALLSLTLLISALAAVRLWGPVEQPSTTAITPAEQGASAGAETPLGRLNQQPTVLRAKPASGEADASVPASPRHWEVGGGVDASASFDSPALFPTGQPLMSSDWLGADLAPHDVHAPAPLADTAEPTATDMVPPLEAPPPSEQSPSGPNTPAPSPVLRVTTEANDSFWKISERVYGTGQYYKALYQHNCQRVASPDRLERGIEIDTPPLPELRALYPQLGTESIRNEPPRGA